MQIKRGDIFYVTGGYATGSEQRPGRPAIIVSNDRNNEHSPTVEVVYLTTKPKRDLPTHTRVKSLSRDSTAICEQITTVSVERIGEFCGHITEAEQAALEKALAVSLGVDDNWTAGGDAQLVSKLTARATEAEARCTVLQQMYESLLSRVVR